MPAWPVIMLAVDKQDVILNDAPRCITPSQLTDAMLADADTAHKLSAGIAASPEIVAALATVAAQATAAALAALPVLAFSEDEARAYTRDRSRSQSAMSADSYDGVSDVVELSNGTTAAYTFSLPAPTALQLGKSIMIICKAAATLRNASLDLTNVKGIAGSSLTFTAVNQAVTLQAGYGKWLAIATNGLNVTISLL